MAVRMLLLSALLVGGAMVVCSSNVETSQDAILYLRKYGYLQPISSEDETYHVTEEEMKEAICHFQYMFNLDETCELDGETLALMNMPRCGMPDVESGLRKPKRYDLASKWSKTDVTYRIDSVTNDIANAESTLVAAWKYWTDVTPITVTRVQGDTEADIYINFYSGEHGDAAPFDGKGKVLAHAKVPDGDFAHFDEDEDWTVGKAEGTNLLQVAVHEFGHNLGLKHSKVATAVMYATRQGRYRENYQLDDDDIKGIQAHYGIKIKPRSVSL